MKITVKPLEWGEQVHGTWHAFAAVAYSAFQDMGNGKYFVRVAFPAEDFLGPFDTLEAAKSAAFADYSARIMSAIEPAGVKSWGEMQAEDCVLSIGSKRTCGHGTLGCVNHHAPPLHIEPAGVGVETLETYFERQIEWSRETFGPALRTGGVIDHIRKELREIEADPHDLSEWVDVVILAMDGFWRHGGKASDLLPALLAKQQKNMARTWPDWRTMSENSAIEHDRSKDIASLKGDEQ